MSAAWSLLCVDNPWDRSLHRVAYSGALPPVQHPTTADPFALTLDDGTRCLFRNGGAWGGRASQGQGSCIDRSQPAWTVKVGPLGAPDAALPPPQTRTVTEAWLAGTRASQ